VFWKCYNIELLVGPINKFCCGAGFEKLSAY